VFEFDQYRSRMRDAPAVRCQLPYRPVDRVEALSFLWWSEHCIECADPDCYATCGLYQPRPDGRCRRFRYGIYRNRRFRSLRGFGAEVAFKTWGKLEADGNEWMEPATRVIRRERRLALVRPLLAAALKLASRIGGQPRWQALAPNPRKLARRLHRRGRPQRPADAFLVEVYNPQDEGVNLQLEIRPVAAGGPAKLSPAPFRTRLRLPAGYSRHRIDRDRFAAVVDCGRPFKIALLPEAEADLTLVFLTLDFIIDGGGTEAGNGEGEPIKCVVFDLDDTLWTGVLVENADVRPKPEVVRLIRALDRRGILVSIASKNDAEVAPRRLQALGLSDYFLHPQIGWGAKSAGIRTIAERLNLGLNAFAFVDDNPFELAEVTRALPEVTCIAAGELAGLLDRPRFRGSGTSDGRFRRQMYQEESRRHAERIEWADDYLGFLKSCEIRLAVDRYRPTDCERVAELIQRTNQLNFSGSRYTAEKTGELLASRADKYVLRCKDRFGSYGTVGFALVDCADGEIRVDDFMLSCRVQGRHIEPAFFAYLMRTYRSPDTLRLFVRFRPTGRNDAALAVLQQTGFRRDRDREGLTLTIGERSLECEVVEVQAGEDSGEDETDAPLRTSTAA
jgi:FkbH-like protein